MNGTLDKIRVQFDYLPLINFAMQQNKVSVIHQLSIENMTSEPFRNIQVQITAEPDFGSITPVMMEAIPANNSVCLQSFSLVLSANYFAQLTERMSGSLKIEIRSEAETIFTRTYPIDILAYDQWGGINIFPEMLAAFITPNHAVLTPIIKRAAAILEQWTGTPSLDEYQSRNPDRVRKQMAAIYTALTEQQIIYSTIPASFEEHGQRVRRREASHGLRERGELRPAGDEIGVGDQAVLAVFAPCHRFRGVETHPAQAQGVLVGAAGLVLAEERIHDPVEQMGAFVAFDDQAFAPDVESPYLVAPFVEHFARDGKNLREPLDEWLHMPYCGVDRYFHM